MSFLLGNVLRGVGTKAATSYETKTATMGLGSKILIGGTAVSLASPILNSLSSIPGVGQIFQPAAQISSQGLGALSSGIGAATGAVNSVGSILSNPTLMLGAGALVLVLLLKK